jgi:hypothetical protein
MKIFGIYNHHKPLLIMLYTIAIVLTLMVAIYTPICFYFPNFCGFLILLLIGYLGAIFDDYGDIEIIYKTKENDRI